MHTLYSELPTGYTGTTTTTFLKNLKKNKKFFASKRALVFQYVEGQKGGKKYGKKGGNLGGFFPISFVLQD